jgi:hypothetical protein
VITHGKAQVRKRKLSLLTVEQSGYPSLLCYINSDHYNFAFMEIDFHTRQEFEAQQ